MALLSLTVTAAVLVRGQTQPGTVHVKSLSVTQQKTTGLMLLSGVGPTGPQGAPGVGANWRGLWLVGTTYALGDGVTGSNGHNYISLVAGNIGHDPTTDGGTNWSDLVSSGPLLTAPVALAAPEIS